MKTRLLAFLTVTFFAVLHPLLALAQPSREPTAPYPPMNWPYHGHMWNGGGGFGWGGPLVMLVLIVVGIVVIFMLGRRSGERWHHHHRGPGHMSGRSPGPTDTWGDPSYSALQILNERFARGEIQKQEYEEKKAAILSTGQR